MRILIIIVAFLAVAGGGGGWWYYNNQNAENEAQAAELEKDPELTYVELDPLHLPVITEKGVTQNISLIIALEVDSSDDADKVNANKPKLVDAYLSDMYGVMGQKKIMKDGVLQVDLVRKRLAYVTRKVLGEDVVSNVLLQLISQRKV